MVGFSDAMVRELWSLEFGRRRDVVLARKEESCQTSRS
jgi:hypothetical protein